MVTVPDDELVACNASLLASASKLGLMSAATLRFQMAVSGKFRWLGGSKSLQYMHEVA